MSQVQVAITGVGVVSSIGIGFDDFAQAILEGRRAGGPLTLFKQENAPLVAEAANFRLENHIQTVKSYIDRTSAMALAACSMAKDQAAWAYASEEEQIQAGLALGTAWGCMDSMLLFEEKLVSAGPKLVPPLIFTHAYANSPNSIISIEYGLRGFNVCFSGGHACGLEVVAYGADQIRLGRARYLLAGGTDALSRFALNGYRSSGMLADKSQPFDSNSTGFLLSEGAAVLALEPAEQAGERAYAILAGSGSSRPDQDPGVLLRAMELALKDAGASPDDLGLVIPSASGQAETDRLEAEALMQFMKRHGKQVPVFPLKALTGEPMAAYGALGIAAAIVLLEEGALPSYSVGAEKAFAGLPMGQAGAKLNGNVALVNSASNGGEIASVALRLP